MVKYEDLCVVVFLGNNFKPNGQNLGHRIPLNETYEYHFSKLSDVLNNFVKVPF